jgi:hypothetical protein
MVIAGNQHRSMETKGAKWCLPSTWKWITFKSVGGPALDLRRARSPREEKFSVHENCAHSTIFDRTPFIPSRR